MPTERGGPATLVLLHGLLGDRHDWDAVMGHLDQPHCLALDLPGHGENATLATPTFAAAHDWLSATLAARGIARYALLGYSLGGRLALYHASREPRGLEALWLESAHPGLPEEERSARLAHDKRWAVRFEQEPLKDVLTDWYRQPVFADLTHAQRRQLIERRSRNHGPAVAAMLRATSLGRQPSLWAWLERSRLPVGYLSGLRDAKFHGLATRLAEAAPHIRHTPLDGGHNLHVEQPRQVARQLGAWHPAGRCLGE